MRSAGYTDVNSGLSDGKSAGKQFATTFLTVNDIFLALVQVHVKKMGTVRSAICHGDRGPMKLEWTGETPILQEVSYILPHS